MSSAPAEFPLQQHLGMTIATTEKGRSVAHVPVTEELLNPNGVVHGAVLFAMADTGMGAATMSMLEEGKYCASIEVQMRFLRPIAHGLITCETSVIQAGRRVVHLESKIENDNAQLAATATGSFAVLSPAS